MAEEDVKVDNETIPTPQLATATEQPQTDNIDLLTTHDIPLSDNNDNVIISY